MCMSVARESVCLQVCLCLLERSVWTRKQKTVISIFFYFVFVYFLYISFYFLQYVYTTCYFLHHFSSHYALVISRQDNITSRRTMSCYIISCHVTSHHATSRNVVTPLNIMSCRVTPHHITSHHVTSRYVTSSSAETCTRNMQSVMSALWESVHGWSWQNSWIVSACVLLFYANDLEEVWSGNYER